jgi:hypothetical protein
MKITTLLCLLFIQVSFSQCRIKDYVPFTLGANRFETSQILSNINTIKREEIYGSDTYSEWKKYPYMKKDSIYVVSTNKRFVANDCFKGSENRCQLYFVDDILYKIAMFQEFKAVEYDKMLNTYNDILEVFDELHHYNKTFTTTNSITKEKIGQGLVFYDFPPNDKIQVVKIKDIRVSYEITYKKIWNNYSKKWDPTSDIDYYTIEIELVDLKGTKLTNLGY